MLAGLLSLLACVGTASKSLASNSVVLVAELPSACSGATTVWFSVLAGSHCCARTWAHGAVVTLRVALSLSVLILRGSTCGRIPGLSAKVGTVVLCRCIWRVLGRSGAGSRTLRLHLRLQSDSSVRWWCRGWRAIAVMKARNGRGSC